MRACPAAFLIAATLGLPAVTCAASDASRAALSPEEQNAIAVFDAAAPSVVQVEASGSESNAEPIAGFQNLFGKAAMPSSLRRTVGGGVLWDAAGHVLTTSAVAIDAGATLTILLADGSRHGATIVGIDKPTDLAVLQIQGPHTGWRLLAPSTFRPALVGQRAYVIGNSYGRGTFFEIGMVGAVDRSMEGGTTHALQLNLAASPGDAGGPALDSLGHLLGLVSGLFANRAYPGYALAIPIEDLARLVPRLIADGRIEHPSMEISIIDPRDRSLPAGIPPGLAVLRPEPGGAGDLAGLKVRDGDAIDVITGIDGAPVRSFPDLRVLLDLHHAGDTCTLTVWRSGTSRTVRLTLASERHRIPSPPASGPLFAPALPVARPVSPAAAVSSPAPRSSPAP